VPLRPLDPSLRRASVLTVPVDQVARHRLGTASPPQRQAERVRSAHERRDPVLPRLKRLRPSGRESRGRAERARVRRDDPGGSLGSVRRRRRRRARLLEARAAPLPGGRRSARAAAGLTLVAALAGCGGGRLSHSDFVKHADAICSAYTAATKPSVQPRTYAQIDAYVQKTLPLYESALRKLEALEPPSKDEAAVRRWLAADRRVAKAVHDLGDAAQRRDFPSVTSAAAQAQLAGSESRSAAAGLGMRVCAQLVSGR
jgi:hypothetical protein